MSTTVALPSCSPNCFEPTVAVDGDGRRFVTYGAGADLAVSSDGGRSYLRLPAPPVPGAVPGQTPTRGDAIVAVSPAGRLYYLAIIETPVPNALQLASSPDAGRTWTMNLTLTAAGIPPQAIALPDRPWLAFGPGDTVYLSYSQVPTGLFVLRSDDGGRTFPTFTRAVGTEERGIIGLAGPVIVASPDRLLLPYFALVAAADAPSGSVAETRIAESDDGGATFVNRVVYRAPLADQAGQGFPIASVGADGNPAVAWWDGDHSTVVARSVNGGTSWSPPVNWGPPGSQAQTCPWIANTGASAGVKVLSYSPRPASNGYTGSLVIGRDPRHPIVVADGLSSSTPCNTDFGMFATTPSGRTVIPFVDAGGQLAVADL